MNTYTQAVPDVAVRHQSSEPLHFRPLTLSDIPEVSSRLHLGRSRTCDYTLGGIYMWIDRFKYSYAIVEDTLFIKGVLEDNPDVIAFSLPIGPMPMERAIALVEQYCHSRGLPAVFSAIPEDRLDEFLAVNPGIAIKPLDNWGDYLYDIESMAFFRGKKMNKKRNHVNRFMADNPAFVVEDIADVSEDELLEFVATAGASEAAASGDMAMAELAAYELDQCLHALANRRVFGYDGVVLRTAPGAPICAMAAGEIVGDTLYVHIEKADHSVSGSGETIAMMMAQRMLARYPGLRYENREEDCGDPGLRLSKESYRPVAILRKFNIFLER